MNKKCTKNEQIRANSQTSRKNGQGACAFIYASETYAEIKKPSPRGEGVNQRETDEGTTTPTDVGLGGVVRLPRIEEEPYTLC